MAIAEASAPGVRAGVITGATGTDNTNEGVSSTARSSGCLAGIFLAFRRAFAKASGKEEEAVIFSVSDVRKAVARTSTCTRATAAAGMSAMSTATDGGLSLFGRRKPQVSAAQRLQTATASLEQRLEAIESKSTAARREAQKLAAGGNRQAAMRALKRSKAYDAQVTKLSAASLAVERQMALLEDVDLQSAIASAMSTSAKDVKRAKRALAGVDQAIDDASDMRDSVEDVHSAIAGLADGAFDDLGLDEEQLSAELDALAELAAPAPAAGKAQIELAEPAGDLSWPSPPTGMMETPVNDEDVALSMRH